ncbi:MAG: hypothetical protein LRZ84_14475 [Desertifilum sp.]|nr:hypothetical protein [Desertifilum sp.]
MSLQPGSLFDSPFDELLNLPTESRKILEKLDTLAPEVREIMKSLPDNLLRLVPNVAKGILENPGDFLNGNDILNNPLDKLNSLLNAVPQEVLKPLTQINSALDVLGGLSPVARNLTLTDAAIAANPVAGSAAKILGLGSGGLGGLMGDGGSVAPKVGNLTVRVRGRIAVNTKIHAIIATPELPEKLKYSKPPERSITEQIENDTIVRGVGYVSISDLGMPEYWGD